jgi:transposase-like protein
MLESSTDGATVDRVAAGREDQGAGGELEFVAGGRAAPVGVPDPELVEQARRRKFTAKYKLRTLQEADACSAPGQIGELLRREGLYTSHLTYWRKQRNDGALKELGRPRGRKPADRRDAEIVGLQRRLERSEAELAKARKVIEIQGNLSALLEQMLGGHHQDPQPTLHLDRQPVLRGALQDSEVPAGVPRPVRRHRARPRSLPRVL